MPEVIPRSGDAPSLVTDEPTGFVDRTASTISFVNGTRTATITPVAASYQYVIKDKWYTKYGPDSVVISNVTGTHFIYFDGDELKEVVGFSPDVLHEYAYVMAILWNATSGEGIMVGDERHGAVMDWVVHWMLHSTIGTRFESGLALGDFVHGDGSANTHCTLSVALGYIWDEDIRHTIAAMAVAAEIPILYRLGATGVWYRKAPDDYPTIYDGAPASYTPANDRIPWNEWTGATWQLTQLPANGVVAIHLFATNNITAFGGQIIGIQGQASYASAAAARDGIQDELAAIILAGLPGQEMKAIATIIIQSSTTYANAPKGRILEVDTGVSYQDWRYDQFSTVVIPGSSSGGGGGSFVPGMDWHPYEASDLLLVGVDWPITINSGAALDSNRSAYAVLLFDDTVVEAAGLPLMWVPATATLCDFKILWRADVSPGADKNMALNMYGMSTTSNGIPDAAWTGPYALTTQVVANENDWVTDTVGIPLASIGAVAGKWVKLAIARNTGVANNLPNDMVAKAIAIRVY